MRLALHMLAFLAAQKISADEAVPPGLVLDGLSASGAWSMSRDLLTSFVGGSRYTNTSGAVSALNDQSGNARHFTQAGATERPLVATAGPNSRACADFISTDGLQAVGAATFMPSNTGYMVVSFIADTTAFSQHGLLADSSTRLFLCVGDEAGATKHAQAVNFDGSTTNTATTIAITLGIPYVAEWKLQSGNVSVRVNGGTWVNTPSLNVITTFGSMYMGTSAFTGLTSLDGKIFEAAIFGTVPTTAQQNAIVADFRTWVGA